MDNPNKTSQTVFDKSLNDSQYSVTPIPSHVHNGMDTARVSYNDLTNKPVAFSIPSGVIWPYGGTSAPTGFLLCDATSYLRTDYPALFTAIGTTYGSADGTHFTVPDGRGNVLVGYKASDTYFGTLGQYRGESVHKLDVNEMPIHSHAPKSPGTSFPSPGGTANYYTSGADASTSFGTTTGNAGGDGSHNNIQPSLTIGGYIIKT